MPTRSRMPTHSRLYVDDWRTLGFDERLGFSAADTLWWLFASPDTRPFRDRLPVLAGIAAADRGDPVLRFVQAEAIEASGNAFFAGVAPVAEEFSTLTGVRYRYFGQYHLDRETRAHRYRERLRGHRPGRRTAHAGAAAVRPGLRRHGGVRRRLL